MWYWKSIRWLHVRFSYGLPANTFSYLLKKSAEIHRKTISPWKSIHNLTHSLCRFCRYRRFETVKTDISDTCLFSCEYILVYCPMHGAFLICICPMCGAFRCKGNTFIWNTQEDSQYIINIINTTAVQDACSIYDTREV